MATARHAANQVGSEIGVTRDTARSICAQRGINFNEYYRQGSVQIRPGMILTKRGNRHYIVTTETKPYDMSQDQDRQVEYDQQVEDQTVRYLRRQFRRVSTSQELTHDQARSQA